MIATNRPRANRNPESNALSCPKLRRRSTPTTLVCSRDNASITFHEPSGEQSLTRITSYVNPEGASASVIAVTRARKQSALRYTGTTIESSRGLSATLPESAGRAASTSFGDSIVQCSGTAEARRVIRSAGRQRPAPLQQGFISDL